MLKNKCTKLVVAIGITLFAGTAQAALIDLAVNGDFETGDFTGWTQFPGAGSQSITTDNNGGDFAGNITVGGGPFNTVLKQANLAAGLLTSGQTVNVSFDAKGSYPDGGVLFVENFSELTGGGVSFNDLKTFGVNNLWQTFSYSTVLGPDVSGGYTLQFAGVCGAAASCVSDTFLDNITITADVSAVPIPAAAWLFGSGLLGLVGVARRKTAAK